MSARSRRRSCKDGIGRRHINIFATAGLWIEVAVEPQLGEDDRRRFPDKRAWLDRHLGMIIFKLRPHPASPNPLAPIS